MHYYQHSIGDYRRDTMHLTLLEHGIYRQLLDLYYLNECELDANALRLICARSAEEIKAAESVLNEFFESTAKGYKHKRCDQEITKFHEKSQKAKASADARWQAKGKSENANGMRTHSEGNANHKPLTNNHIINAKGSRLTNEWVLPNDWIDAAKAIKPDFTSAQIKFIADGFKDYWISLAGAKGVRADWLATWRNWIRKQEVPQGKQQDSDREKLKKDLL
jgi:uncharacterized protein YdaU (DUF1376 family)